MESRKKYESIGKEELPIVIYIPVEGFGNQIKLAEMSLEELRKRKGVFYGIPNHIAVLDLALNATAQYDRVILTHRHLNYENEGRIVRQDLTERLRNILNHRTRIVYFSYNGDGEEFRASLPEEKKRQVKLITKTYESFHSFEEYIFKWEN